MHVRGLHVCCAHSCFDTPGVRGKCCVPTALCNVCNHETESARENGLRSMPVVVILTGLWRSGATSRQACMREACRTYGTTVSSPAHLALPPVGVKAHGTHKV